MLAGFDVMSFERIFSKNHPRCRREKRHRLADLSGLCQLPDLPLSHVPVLESLAGCFQKPQSAVAYIVVIAVANPEILFVGQQVFLLSSDKLGTVNGK